MARRSTKLIAPAPVTGAAVSNASAPQNSRTASPFTAAPLTAPMNVPAVPRPAPPPVKPGVVTFLGLAGEIRNQIYGELLPDKAVHTAQSSKKLRLDGQRTSTAFVATCHQVYDEAVSILYPSTVAGTLLLKVNSAGTTTFLGRLNKLVTAKPSNFSVVTRAKRLDLDIEVGELLQSAAVCDIQDAMFNFTKLLSHGLQLEGIAFSTDIGADSQPNNVWDDWDDWSDLYDFWDVRESRGMIGRMQEFKSIKPGDISRAHIVAFLTDPLRMIRGVKQSRSKYSMLSLDFPGKSGKPWRDLHGQVYELIRGNAPVAEYTTFTRYFDALRQLKRVFYCFGEKKAKGVGAKGESGKDVYEKHAEKLGQALIRADMQKFKEAHGNLLAVIEANIAQRIKFNKTHSYQMAELREHWCRELIYLKMELEAALPNEDFDVSFRGYNVADAGLHEWQTVGRKEALKVKKKRKADKAALVESIESAKKAKLAEKDPPDPTDGETEEESE